jgi:integrase
VSLSDAKVRNAKPQTKPYKISDGEGLFLLVAPSGSKYWRFKYLFAGKEKLLALGVYPEISLGKARERRAQAREMVADGKDPSEAKREARRLAVLKGENTFEAIAREWHKSRLHSWSENYAGKVLKSLERDVFPKLGTRPIADISAAELLSALRAVEKRGVNETAHRVKQLCGMIFLYAVASDLAKHNPAADLKSALQPVKKKHYHYLQADELPEYLQKLEAYDGEPMTKLALKMLLLTFVRTIELRGAEWSEINFDKAEWRIPAERMKMKDPHIVPLSRQAIEVLKELQKHSGNRVHIFPNSNRPITYMSENTMLFALYRMGYHSRTTGHGFRSTASTVLNENGFRSDVIERQLAHAERNSVRRAYNHAQYLTERREMMQWWADHLDEIAQKN